MTIDDLVARLRERLRGRVDEPALEAELLAAAALELERGRLLARGRDAAPDAAVERALGFAERRAAGEPVAWLVGFREFHGRRFELAPGVLVPRPETEHLVEVALAAGPRGRWCDLCTGSGVVAITLALECPALRCVAIDLAPAAVACAQRNAASLGAAERVAVVRGDLLAALCPRAGLLDGLVANPPYVEPEDFPRLPPEIQRFEPRLALAPRAESAAAFRARLVDQARARLARGGFLAIEVGAGQAGVARDQLVAAGFRGVTVTNDLAGIGRVVAGRLRG